MCNSSSSRWTRVAGLASLLALAFGRPAPAQSALSAEAEPSAQIEVEPLSIAVVVEGIVLEPDGAPAEGAVVLSSAGGKTVADASGSFRLEVRVSLGAESLHVTAAGRGSPNRLASTSVALTTAPGTLRVGPMQLALGASCAPSWVPTFGEERGVTGTVLEIAVFDDGSGPAVFAAGFLSSAGATSTTGIAKWDGSRWSSPGGGTNGAVYSLATFDDGGGPALYAGGQFTTAGGIPASGIAKWNGSGWSALGNGLNGKVEALAVFDDGSGPALYAGGNSTSAGSPSAWVLEWDGSAWSTLGSGITSLGNNPHVYALIPFDDGSGPALYVGGSSISSGPSLNIARWDGSSWTGLGSGTSFIENSVDGLAVFDDGSGPALYAGGSFTTMGGTPASRIAKWDGSLWTALGSEVNGFVRALKVFDDGSGAALFAGGDFTTAGGMPASRIARWNGSTWAALGGGVTGGYVSGLATLTSGNESVLYVGGEFTRAGDIGLKGIASWDGASWAALGSGLPWHVHALAEFDDGSGPALFAAVAGPSQAGMVKWTGSAWPPLPEGALFYVDALATFDDGAGSALYAGGTFTSAGGVAANRVAKWNGSSWAPLGSGIGGLGGPFSVEALTTFDDGSGPALYVGGEFGTAGGVFVSNIARWDGSSWSALGSGVNNTVYALTTFDDGTGPALYAGGDFNQAGSVFVNRIAKWNGSSWAPLGSGTTGLGGRVRALATFYDGSGPALYAAGKFTAAGGIPANRIARWDGSTWAPLGNGIGGFQLAEVHALTAFEDGLGPCLVAAGRFSLAGDVLARSIARWDGSSWTALGSGLVLPSADPVHALLAFDEPNGPALYAGGAFLSAPDSGDSYLAKWGCPPDLEPPVLSCPDYVLAGERIGSPPGEIVTFSVTATDLEDPAPVVVCVPPSGSVFPVGRTLVTCTATDASGNQATCQFRVTVARGVR